MTQAKTIGYEINLVAYREGRSVTDEEAMQLFNRLIDVIDGEMDLYCGGGMKPINMDIGRVKRKPSWLMLTSIERQHILIALEKAYKDEWCADCTSIKRKLRTIKAMNDL